MTSRLGIEVTGDRVDWAVLHRVLRGPMQLVTGSVPASVGIDEHDRLVAGPVDGQPGVRDRVDRLPARLGDPTPLIVGGVPYGAERLLATVLAAAVEAASRAAHDAPLHTVLAHPDGLDSLRIDLLREAARYAGIAATASQAGTTGAAAALVRTPATVGEGPGAAVGAAQLAWERRPDDDHTAAALGTASGAAVVGGTAMLGVGGSAASATTPTGGPVGTPLAPPAAGPTGAPVTGPVAGPEAGPQGAALTPRTASDVAAADHAPRQRKRTSLPRGRLLAGAAAVVVLGTGVGIIAASGDDGTATQVGTTDVATSTTATSTTGAGTVEAGTTLDTGTEPAPAPEVTIIVSTEPPASAVAAAPAAPQAPGTVAAAPGGAAATTGWIIDDTITTGAVQRQFDSISCASELGPWHIVETFTVDGLISADVSFDVALTPDFTGTAVGSERSSWTGGMEVTATSAGTANLASQSTGGYLLFIDYDEDVQIVDPVAGDETQHNHHTLELHVLPAPVGACP